MSNFAKGNEKWVSTPALLLSSQDRSQRAVILPRHQRENRDGENSCADTGPPVELATAIMPCSSGFSKENVISDTASSNILYDRLLCERPTPRGSEGEMVRSSKSQHLFDRAYEEYFSTADSKLNQDITKETCIFSKPINPLEKSVSATHESQRREEHQHSIEKFASEGVFYSKDQFENVASEMPGATFSALDSGLISKLTATSNINLSLPASPQRSSSSSTSDNGNSAFMNMAKRLHRLRLSAVSSNQELFTDPAKTSEFISIEPLDGKTVSNVNLTENKSTLIMPPIARENDRPVEHHISSQVASTTPSISDLSACSFYRLPPAQDQQTLSFIGSKKSASTSFLEKGKIWSSEPILMANSSAGINIDNDGYLLHSKNDREENGWRNVMDGEPRILRNKDLPVQRETIRSTRNLNDINTSRNNIANHEFDDDHVHESHLPRTSSWSFSAPPPKSLHSGRLSSQMNNVNANDNYGRLPGYSRLQTADLPPLGPLRSSTLTKDVKSTSNSFRNADESDRIEQRSIPGSFSRLMDAMASHPTGSLDITQLKAILREQRKLYKRRLEKEKAKREALEELLVKLNSTPRLRHHSLSSTSSTSTIREKMKRSEINGDSSADLSSVIINSLHSSSNDGGSIKSEDVCLLELIQQHLRMKQALRTTEQASHTRKVHRNASFTSIEENARNGAGAANGLDDDDIPMGGEAATGPTGSPKAGTSHQALPNGQAKLYDSHRSQSNPVVPGYQNGVIDKEALKLALDSSGSCSERDGRSSILQRQRRKWDTTANVKADKETERSNQEILYRSGGSSRRRGQAWIGPQPSVAYFVPARNEMEMRSGFVELSETKPLQSAFLEGNHKFIERSQIRQDKIKAASALRSEMARRLRELAENVAIGRVRLEEASKDLLLYELPHPSAFSRLEMIRASKTKYDQLPEIVARRNKLKRESELATNRVLAKLFKQRLAYDRILKKMPKRNSTSTITLSQEFNCNGHSSTNRLLNH